jgi:hypothetical protein
VVNRKVVRGLMFKPRISSEPVSASRDKRLLPVEEGLPKSGLASFSNTNTMRVVETCKEPKEVCEVVDGGD